MRTRIKFRGVSFDFGASGFERERGVCECAGRYYSSISGAGSDLVALTADIDIDLDAIKRGETGVEASEQARHLNYDFYVSTYVSTN